MSLLVIVDYLASLGVTDCYASSYLKAVPGSLHGYDVVDPTRLNPEIGSDAEYAAWVDALSTRRMGHILDVVPNHMGIAQSANPWWNDVLENGASSRYARFFDIAWQPVKDELANKVLIPILGDQYGAALERQELTVECVDGAFGVRYFDNWIPIAPDTYGHILKPDLDAWLTTHGSDIDPNDVDELRSILTAADNLPARTTDDPDAILVRAREKEVVKRRLAAVLERSAGMRAFVEGAVRTLNGVTGEPRSFDPLDRLLDAQSIASRTGGLRLKRSTTVASSTSTSSRRCAWKTRWSSTKSTASCSISSRVAPRPGCESITSMASMPPATTCSRLQAHSLRWPVRRGRKNLGPDEDLPRLARARHHRLRLRRRRQQPVRGWPGIRELFRRHLLALRARTRGNGSPSTTLL